MYGGGLLYSWGSTLLQHSKVLTSLINVALKMCMRIDNALNMYMGLSIHKVVVFVGVILYRRWMLLWKWGVLYSWGCCIQGSLCTQIYSNTCAFNQRH